MDGKIICRFTQPQNKPYAFSTKTTKLSLDTDYSFWREIKYFLDFEEERFVKSARVKSSS